jgi:hypothetical protein
MRRRTQRGEDNQAIIAAVTGNKGEGEEESEDDEDAEEMETLK